MNATVTLIRRLNERRELNRWLREERRHRYERLPVSDWIERDINPNGPRHPVPRGPVDTPAPAPDRQRKLLHWPVFIGHSGAAL
ncbi:hypothetical protein [Saccharospirillum salsuginis]|nr:hypothetical protein [Saccharospirillum salsuginis]